MRGSFKKAKVMKALLEPGFYRPSTNCYEGVYGLQHQLGYLATHYRQGSSSNIITGNVA